MAMPSFMDMALDEARQAAARGEVPVGCVIVRDGAVVATAGNRTLADHDPTAHAEMLAIRAAAAKLGSERLTACDLYVTLEPCAMCAAAISFAPIASKSIRCSNSRSLTVRYRVTDFAAQVDPVPDPGACAEHTAQCRQLLLIERITQVLGQPLLESTNEGVLVQRSVGVGLGIGRARLVRFG